MKKVFTAILLFSVFHIAHATLIHYSLGGQLTLADTNFNNIHTATLFGDMYISDIPLTTGTPGLDQSNYWNIASFAINGGDRGWGGSGTIWTPLYGSLETRIHIDDPGGTDWSTGSASFYDVGFTDPNQLPDEMNWPGFGWYFGSQYFVQINSLNMTRVSASVSEPPAAALLCIGLAAFIAYRRKRKGKHCLSS